MGVAEIAHIRVLIMWTYHSQPTIIQHALPKCRAPPVWHPGRKKGTRHFSIHSRLWGLTSPFLKGVGNKALENMYFVLKIFFWFPSRLWVCFPCLFVCFRNASRNAQGLLKTWCSRDHVVLGLNLGFLQNMGSSFWSHLSDPECALFLQRKKM